MYQYFQNMEFWLKASPTLAALIVPFLTYYLVGKRMKRYKADISKELEIHKLQLQAAFQTKFYEFQTRYSWLHQKRAEAIEKLYVMLARVENDLQYWVTSTYDLRNQTEDEHYRTAEDHFQEMINFFDEKRIYFDEETSESVFEMAQATRVLYDHYTSVQWAVGSASEQASWLKQRAAQLKEQNINPLMALLEDTFKRLLDAETASHHLDRASLPDSGPYRTQQSKSGFWRRIGALWGRRPKDGINT
jgi:hypothetical protein